jgi:hypothetical protein
MIAMRIDCSDWWLVLRQEDDLVTCRITSLAWYMWLKLHSAPQVTSLGSLPPPEGHLQGAADISQDELEGAGRA